MPIYEYRCEGCGERFARLFASRRAVAEAVVTCPACGSDVVRRLFSPVAVHSGGRPRGEGEQEERKPRIKELFGRKELQEALKRRGY